MTKRERRQKHAEKYAKTRWAPRGNSNPGALFERARDAMRVVPHNGRVKIFTPEECSALQESMQKTTTK